MLTLVEFIKSQANDFHFLPRVNEMTVALKIILMCTIEKCINLHQLFTTECIILRIPLCRGRKIILTLFPNIFIQFSSCPIQFFIRLLPHLVHFYCFVLHFLYYIPVLSLFSLFKVFFVHMKRFPSPFHKINFSRFFIH